jgi:AcrR family transcriptional regulator
MARRTLPKRPTVRGRRQAQQARSRETVQRILDSAMVLIAEKGDAVTMSEIASRSGVVIGALYRYFADRRAINRALLLKHFDQVDTMLRERIAGVASREEFVATMQAVYKLYFDMHQHDPLYRNLWTMVQVDSELQALDVEDTLNNARNLCAVARPLFPQADPDELMAVAVFLLHFAASSSRLALTLPGRMGRRMRSIFQDVIASSFESLGRGRRKESSVRRGRT